MKISTDTYILMQTHFATAMIGATGGKFNPVNAKAGADMIVEANGCQIVDVVQETEETRQKDLEKKLTL